MRKNNEKYIKWIIIGLLLGILTGYLRSFNPFSFWAFSDLAGRYGFWIITVFLIAYFSKNENEAFKKSSIYMICMCLSYYIYLYISKDKIYIKQFILWTIFSIIVSYYAKLLRKNKEKSTIVYLIPLLLLILEFIQLLTFFIKYQTNFFQLIIDLIGIIIIIRKKKIK